MTLTGVFVTTDENIVLKLSDMDRQEIHDFLQKITNILFSLGHYGYSSHPLGKHRFRIEEIENDWLIYPHELLDGLNLPWTSEDAIWGQLEISDEFIQTFIQHKWETLENYAHVLKNHNVLNPVYTDPPFSLSDDEYKAFRAYYEILPNNGWDMYGRQCIDIYTANIECGILYPELGEHKALYNFVEEIVKRRIDNLKPEELYILKPFVFHY